MRMQPRGQLASVRLRSTLNRAGKEVELYWLTSESGWRRAEKIIFVEIPSSISFFFSTAVENNEKIEQHKEGTGGVGGSQKCSTDEWWGRGGGQIQNNEWNRGGKRSLAGVYN